VRDIIEIIIFLRTVIIAMLIMLRTRTVKVVAVVVKAVAVTMRLRVIIFMLVGLNDKLVHKLNRILLIISLLIRRR